MTCATGLTVLVGDILVFWGIYWSVKRMLSVLVDASLPLTNPLEAREWSNRVLEQRNFDAEGRVVQRTALRVSLHVVPRGSMTAREAAEFRDRLKGAPYARWLNQLPSVPGADQEVHDEWRVQDRDYRPGWAKPEGG